MDVSPQDNIIDFKDVPDDCKAMLSRDFTTMQHFEFGGTRCWKNHAESGFFRRVHQNVFFFVFRTPHAIFSKIEIFHIRMLCLRGKQIVINTTWDVTDEQRALNLLPFFVDDVERIIPPGATCISLSPHKSYVHYSEIDWTQRLVEGLRKAMPLNNVHFTARSQSFPDIIELLDLAPDFEMFYLCRGFPDILVESEAVINVIDDGFSMWCESNEDYLKKCGEMFGALHCLLSTKAIKRVLCQGSAAELSGITANGLLLDKICGSTLCRLSVGENAESLEFSLGRLPRSYMSHANLWLQMKCLLNGMHFY